MERLVQQHVQGFAQGVQFGSAETGTGMGMTGVKPVLFQATAPGAKNLRISYPVARPQTLAQQPGNGIIR
ncbi:hypothetical protein [Oceanimonas baumannii]|uniref:hypothetical protein n=1 Tax=Oceanimonas baumannii TaxID=129578 RepID=UPI001AB052B1|nr:hypothetical protein [Oceanimonas baumannii]